MKPKSFVELVFKIYEGVAPKVTSVDIGKLTKAMGKNAALQAGEHTHKLDPDIARIASAARGKTILGGELGPKRTPEQDKAIDAQATDLVISNTTPKPIVPVGEVKAQVPMSEQLGVNFATNRKNPVHVHIRSIPPHLVAGQKCQGSGCGGNGTIVAATFIPEEVEGEHVKANGKGDEFIPKVDASGNAYEESQHAYAYRRPLRVGTHVTSGKAATSTGSTTNTASKLNLSDFHKKVTDRITKHNSKLTAGTDAWKEAYGEHAAQIIAEDPHLDFASVAEGTPVMSSSFLGLNARVSCGHPDCLADAGIDFEKAQATSRFLDKTSEKPSAPNKVSFHTFQKRKVKGYIKKKVTDSKGNTTEVEHEAMKPYFTRNLEPATGDWDAMKVTDSKSEVETPGGSVKPLVRQEYITPHWLDSLAEFNKFKEHNGMLTPDFMSVNYSKDDKKVLGDGKKARNRPTNIKRATGLMHTHSDRSLNFGGGRRDGDTTKTSSWGPRGQHGTPTGLTVPIDTPSDAEVDSIETSPAYAEIWKNAQEMLPSLFGKKK